MIRKNHPKVKYNCIKPEEVVDNTLYTFSFNPEEQPMFQKFYSMTLNNLKDWSQQQHNILTSLKYCKVECYMEISSGGRLHFHGYIKITDTVNFFLKTIKHIRHYGTYEIDHITDHEKWSEYVSKMEKKMKTFCENHSMIYKINNFD